MPSIRKRNQKWQVQIRRKGSTPVTRTFTRKSDAEHWARSMEARADRHDLPHDVQELKRISVANLLVRYRDTVVERKRCRVVERSIINVMMRAPFAHVMLSELSPTLLSEYRDARLAIVAPVTINRELGLLSHAFNIARTEWGIPLASNPVAGIRRPSVGPKRDRRLLSGEFRALMVAARQCRNHHIRPLVMLAILTAMRQGELLRIQRADIDFGLRTLHIPLTKNGEPRTIPLSKRACQVLHYLNARSDNVRLFPISTESVKNAWQRLIRRAEISGLHFHDLRHEAVSRFFERGLSLPEVALISGHKDPRMLFRYTHLKAEHVARKL